MAWPTAFVQAHEFVVCAQVRDQCWWERSARPSGGLVMRRSRVRIPKAAPTNRRSEAIRGALLHMFGDERGMDVCVGQSLSALWMLGRRTSASMAHMEGRRGAALEERERTLMRCVLFAVRWGVSRRSRLGSAVDFERHGMG